MQTASSSVPQEAVSTVTGGVTAWLTVRIPLMKQTVVSWRFLRVQTVDHRFMYALLSFLKGKRIQSSPVPGWFHPPYRLRGHLELSILGLHLPVPWIQVAHLPVFTCLSISASISTSLSWVLSVTPQVWKRRTAASSAARFPLYQHYSRQQRKRDNQCQVENQSWPGSTSDQVKAPKPEECFLSKNDFFVQ